MSDHNPDDGTIPERATIRQEYVKCGNPDCTKKHGPYFYAYWKVGGKLKKAYIGSSLEQGKQEYKIMRTRQMPRWIQRKLGVIQGLAEEGFPPAITYLDRIRRNECGLRWAYRVVNECFQRQVISRMVADGADADDPAILASYIRAASMDLDEE